VCPLSLLAQFSDVGAFPPAAASRLVTLGLKAVAQGRTDMQFGLSDEQEMIVSTVRSFVEKEIYPHEADVERTGEVPPGLGEEIKRKVIDLGFYA
jgi:hypothetical protein